MSDSSSEYTMTVTGGVGSVRWTMSEIVDSAEELARIAELMLPLIARLRSETVWLSQAAWGSATYPGAALSAMTNAQWRCGAVQVATAQLAVQAAQAASNYAAAEEDAANGKAIRERLAAWNSGMAVWQLGPLGPLKAAGDLLHWLDYAARNGLRDATEKLLRDGGAYGAGAMRPGIGNMYLMAMRRVNARETGAAAAVTVRRLFDAAGAATPGRMVVRRVPEQEFSPGTAPYMPPGHASVEDGTPWQMEVSFEGALSGSNDAYKYPPGSIGVIQVPRPDGSNAWVVHLPGTEDWSTVDSENPFDMEGNMEAMTAAQQETFEQQQILIQELIKHGLKDSGALPGDDIVLTGHSGGGIHAAAAAASPAFLADVNLKMIVIAGAPGRHARVGPEIAVLDLENTHDIVTALDFGPPPESPHWVSVTSHRPPGLTGSAHGGLGTLIKEAHSSENYLEDAAQLDQSTQPAIVAHKEKLVELLAQNPASGAVGAALVVQGTKRVYQGRDVPNPPLPQPHGSEVRPKARKEDARSIRGGR